MTTNECGFTLALSSREGMMMLRNGESIRVDNLEYKVAYEDGSCLQMFYNNSPHKIVWSDQINDYASRNGHVVILNQNINVAKITMIGDENHQLNIANAVDVAYDYGKTNSSNPKITNESGCTLMIEGKKVKNGGFIRSTNKEIHIKSAGFSTKIYSQDLGSDVYIVSTEANEYMYLNLPETHYTDAFVMRKRPIIMEYSIYPHASIVLAIPNRVAIVRPMSIDDYNEYDKSTIPWGLMLALIIIVIVAVIVVAISVAGGAMMLSKNKFDLTQ